MDELLEQLEALNAADVQAAIAEKKAELKRLRKLLVLAKTTGEGAPRSRNRGPP